MSPDRPEIQTLAGDIQLTAMPLDRTTAREDALSEVIYGLGLLLRVSKTMMPERARGVEMALEYVRAIQEADE